MSIDRIKDRIRKLLNVAADDAASNGEIENAVVAARNMMIAYQLEEAECTLESDAPTEQGQTPASTIGTKITRWEAWLAIVVCDLIGGVQTYQNVDNNRPTQIVGGKVKSFGSFMFYGATLEADLAAETYRELSTTIATMAKLRFGGWFRGDGANYALGFVSGLALQIRRADNLAQKDETGNALVVQALAIIEAKKETGSAWLVKSKGIKLGKSGGSRSGSRTGSKDSYNAGRADGQSANLDGVGRRSKQLT